MANYTIDVNSRNCQINIDLSQYQKNTQKAQYALDSMVMTHMIPYMPMITGNFVQLTKAQSASWAGSGKVCAALSNNVVPYGRFLYEGKVMVGVESGSPWARLGEKKIVTDRNLQYTKTSHPQATSHWFEKAKDKHYNNWKKVVENVLVTGRFNG